MMNFKELRETKEISISSAANHINVSCQTMRNKESGRTEFTLKEVRKLAKLYDVSLDEVID